MVLVAVDIGIEIAQIQEEGAAFLVLEEGDDLILNQTSQLPFAHREIFCCLFRAEQPSGMCRHCSHNEFLLIQGKA
jgi:hypothetical protein